MSKTKPTPNRKLVFDLKDILATYIGESGGGHPHDYIDQETAKIQMTCTAAGKPQFAITWDGWPQDDPGYGQ